MSVAKMDLFNMGKVEIKPTNFDDGSFWICYKDREGRRGYSLIQADKISVCSLESENLMRDLEYCEDSIVYLEESEMQDFDLVRDSLKEDIEMYPMLNKYIDFVEIPSKRSIGIDMQILTEILF